MRNLTMGRRTALGLLAAAALIRPATAQSGPIRIGVPTAMTGTWAVLGAQVVRTCRLWARTVNAEEIIAVLDTHFARRPARSTCRISL